MRKVSFFVLTVNGEKVTYGTPDGGGGKRKLLPNVNLDAARTAIEAADPTSFDDDRDFYKALALGRVLEGATVEGTLLYTEFQSDDGGVVGRVWVDGSVKRYHGGSAEDRVEFCLQHGLTPDARDHAIVRLRTMLDDEGRELLSTLFKDA